jgi:hypothetical protein
MRVMQMVYVAFFLFCGMKTLQFSHSTSDEHLGCFYHSAIMHGSAINVLVSVSGGHKHTICLF